MKSNRDKAIRYTLQYEGGYSNHPSDPGGPTNYGITIHDARKYWKPGATASDVRSMPKSVAINIYVSKYWNRMNCDSDPSGVDFVTFDYGVNSGPGRAVPVRAKTKNDDPVKWVKNICRERLAFLHRLRTWGTFGKGWGRRVADVEAKGVKMALEAKGMSKPEVKEALQVEQTAAKEDAQKQATFSGTTATADAVHASSWDWSTMGVWPKIGLIVLGVALAAVAAYCLYLWWANRHREKAYLAAQAG